jgi:hypothetical protein
MDYYTYKDYTDAILDKLRSSGQLVTQRRPYLSYPDAFSRAHCPFFFRCYTLFPGNYYLYLYEHWDIQNWSPQSRTFPIPLLKKYDYHYGKYSKLEKNGQPKWSSDVTIRVDFNVEKQFKHELVLPHLHYNNRKTHYFQSSGKNIVEGLPPFTDERWMEFFVDKLLEAVKTGKSAKETFGFTLDGA